MVPLARTSRGAALWWAWTGEPTAEPLDYYQVYVHNMTQDKKKVFIADKWTHTFTVPLELNSGHQYRFTVEGVALAKNKAGTLTRVTAMTGTSDTHRTGMRPIF